MERYNVYKVGNPGCRYKRKLHDKGLKKALNAEYSPQPQRIRVPHRTVFVYGIDFDTDEETLNRKFRKFGDIASLTLVRDLVTGESNGYAFVEFLDSYSAEQAYRYGHKMAVDQKKVMVDWMRAGAQEGWVPRRLGGGLGGNKKSRQMRFKY